jgi:hypothetical protein
MALDSSKTDGKRAVSLVAGRWRTQWPPAAAMCCLTLGLLAVLASPRAVLADAPDAAAAKRDASAEKPDEDAAAGEQVDFGMSLKAEGGGLKNVIGTVTVPADWPNQQRVREVKREIPPGATVSYKLIEDVGRQMTVKIPSLPPGKEVRAVVTFEVRRLTVPPPSEDAGRLTCPDARTAGRKMAVYLASSPKIESDDPQVRQAAQEATAGLTGAWEKVQAIHQWVHKNITFTGGLENVQTCPQTLQRRQGVCAEVNSLTVAMLRASHFPARLVRIPNHVYYEVYLLDSEGGGHWLAGDAGARPTITLDDRPGGMILQKGDNVSITDPGTHRRTKGRILSETATGTSLTPAARVQFQPISPAFKPSPSPSGRGSG